MKASFANVKKLMSKKSTPKEAPAKKSTKQPAAKHRPVKPAPSGWCGCALIEGPSMVLFPSRTVKNEKLWYCKTHVKFHLEPCE